MSVLERCPSYRESNKGSKERQGPTLSVCFTEVSVIYFIVTVLPACVERVSSRVRRESRKRTQKRGILFSPQLLRNISTRNARLVEASLLPHSNKKRFKKTKKGSTFKSVKRFVLKLRGAWRSTVGITGNPNKRLSRAEGRRVINFRYR